MGSATPKYINPMPIPAAKSIEIQEKNEYWGSELSAPKRTFPIRLNANTKRNITKNDTRRIYTQLRSL